MPEKQLKTLTPAQYAFVSWLYTNHPNIAREAEERREQLAGFMDSLTNVFNTVVTKAPDLLNQYVTGKQQIELLKVNLARAKANEYPIDQSGSLYTGGAPQMRATTGGIPAWALVAGAGLVLYLLLKR